MTLAQYTALRSDSLVSSPGYRTLKSLEELYLVDHEDELAEIAEESFIEDLVGVRLVRYHSRRKSRDCVHIKINRSLHFRPE